MQVTKTKTSDESEYVSTREAYELLGVCRASLDNYVRRGMLERYEQRAPMRTRYKRSELMVLKRIRKKYQ